MGRPGMSARFVATSSGPGAGGGSGGGGGGGGGGLYAFADGSSFEFNNGGQEGPDGRSISAMRSYYTSRNGGDSWVNDYLNQGPYQGIQAWTVGKSGTYTVRCAGARGGNGRNRSPGNAYTKAAQFNFTQGETIYIVVGQRGNGNNGGGGGGSFLYYNSSANPLIAGAGGGGSDKIFWENGQTVTTSYQIGDDFGAACNAMSAGPITINNGVTVTINSGETWTIV